MKLKICFENHTRQQTRLFTKFCLFSIYFINLILSSKSETCNNGLGLCQGISKCQVYAQIPFLDLRTITFCDRSNVIVCCPQLRYEALSFESRFNERPSDRDCKEWQQKIYPKCPPEGLISSGTNAQAKEFPHLALVGSYTNSKYDWYCGGALISPKFVITAAHCLYRQNDGPPNRVRLGVIDYTSSGEEKTKQEFTIKNYTEYPEYKFEENYWDIALLELNGEAEINEYVVPICLPHTNGSEYSRLYAAGWGHLGATREKATHLQKVKLERFNDQDCKKKIGKPDDLSDGIRSTHQICAGSFTDARDTCSGDSGGPLFIEHALPCMFELQGITSFAPGGCGTKGSPGVYTRLLPFIDWIESIVWNKN